MFTPIAHAQAGTQHLLGLPIKLSMTPGKIRRSAPLLGEHGEEILAELRTAK
jgi:crotonobetainyl-CoA:carnitine CoA-transferase CaiB-like acyl-CoA transferase